MKNKETKKRVIDFENADFEVLVKIAREELDGILKSINLQILNLRNTLNFTRTNDLSRQNEISYGKAVENKFESFRGKVETDDEFCVKLWLENKRILQEDKFSLYNFSNKNELKKLKKVFDKYAIVDYPDYYMKLLLSETPENFKKIAYNSIIGKFCREVFNNFDRVEDLLLPAYQDLEIKNLPIPLDYPYVHKDAISLMDNINVYSKEEQLHLLKAIKVCDNHFLKIWSTIDTGSLNDIYYKDEEAKSKLVDERINLLLAKTVGNKKQDFCFGKFSDEAYFNFISNGYVKDDREHNHIHSIFTHYMTLEELQASNVDLIESVKKFKM